MIGAVFAHAPVPGISELIDRVLSVDVIVPGEDPPRTNLRPVMFNVLLHRTVIVSGVQVNVIEVIVLHELGRVRGSHDEEFYFAFRPFFHSVSGFVEIRVLRRCIVRARFDVALLLSPEIHQLVLRTRLPYVEAFLRQDALLNAHFDGRFELHLIQVVEEFQSAYNGRKLAKERAFFFVPRQIIIAVVVAIALLFVGRPVFLRGGRAFVASILLRCGRGFIVGGRVVVRCIKRNALALT
mmetsp:Transcript_5929/g.12975  ORF Transcript_5929/g.12975 Transcript_5929/m.12975 type:complete len:239 (-) Transcript_5929:188-904(-)